MGSFATGKKKAGGDSRFPPPPPLFDSEDDGRLLCVVNTRVCFCFAQHDDTAFRCYCGSFGCWFCDGILIVRRRPSIMSVLTYFACNGEEKQARTSEPADAAASLPFFRLSTTPTSSAVFFCYFRHSCRPTGDVDRTVQVGEKLEHHPHRPLRLYEQTACRDHHFP